MIGDPIPSEATGGDVVNIDNVADVDLIKQGDQIKIVSLAEDSSGEHGSLNQISPFYLVIAKSTTGKELQLDRVPADNNQNPIVGDVGVYRDTLRIFSHRVLKSPIKKSGDFEILTRWRIILS